MTGQRAPLPGVPLSPGVMVEEGASPPGRTQTIQGQSEASYLDLDPSGDLPEIWRPSG